MEFVFAEFNPNWQMVHKANNWTQQRGSFQTTECITAAQKVAAITGVCELAHEDQKEGVRGGLGHTLRIFFKRQNPKKPKQHF